MKSEIILVFGELSESQGFSTSKSETVQGAIADLYDYCGGTISSELFRRLVTKLSVVEAKDLFDNLSSEPKLLGVYTGCNPVDMSENLR